MSFLRHSLIAAHDEQNYDRDNLPQFKNNRLQVRSSSSQHLSYETDKLTNSLEFVFCFPDKAVKYIMRSLW